MDLVKNVLGEGSPGNARLICAEDQSEPRVLQTPERFPDTGKKGDAIRGVQVSGIFNQGPVTIEKHGGVWQGSDTNQTL